MSGLKREGIRLSDGWRVERTPHAEVLALIVKLHYSKGGPRTACLSSGLLTPEGKLVGGTLWLPPPPGAAKWAVKHTECDYPKVITLSRMVIEEDVGKNAASLMLGSNVKTLRADGYQVAVTYADRLEGHTGGVYQASNWVYVGETATRPRWVDPEGAMRSLRCTVNISAKEARARGWKRVPGLPKAIFVYAVNRRYRKNVEAMRKPYPVLAPA